MAPRQQLFICRDQRCVALKRGCHAEAVCGIIGQTGQVKCAQGDCAIQRQLQNDGRKETLAPLRQR